MIIKYLRLRIVAVVVVSGMGSSFCIPVDSDSDTGSSGHCLRIHRDALSPHRTYVEKGFIRGWISVRPGSYGQAQHLSHDLDAVEPHDRVRIGLQIGPVVSSWFGYFLAFLICSLIAAPWNPCREVPAVRHDGWKIKMDIIGSSIARSPTHLI